MSTILDALRKLEEERHSRTADARSRLLLSPSPQTRPLLLRRSSWRTRGNFLSVIGLLVAGFSAGAGFVFWRSYTDQTASAAPKTVASSPLPSATRPNTPPAPLQSVSETIPSETISEEQASNSPSSSMPTTSPLSPPSPPEEPHSTLASVSAVQRSPFVATPPASVEPTSTQRETTSAAKHAPAPSLPAIEDKQQEESLYEVLLPNGATRSVKSPSTSLPAGTTTIQEPPSGTALSFLQWSSDPEKRIAFLRVNGGPLTMAHEGDTIGGYTVVEIRQNSVELQSGETRMTLRSY